MQAICTLSYRLVSKRDAYAIVYRDEDPTKIAAVFDYQRLNGGLGRREKFAYFERYVFGRSANEASIDRLAQAYRELVYRAVLDCPLVPGAMGFLQRARGRVDMHVISGTPQEELADIVRIRHLDSFFKSVYGSPLSKRDAFARIIADNGYDVRAMVAVGDATTEFDAARELGVPFLGIVPLGEDDPFPEGIATLPSMQGLAAALGLA
jgi:phosphoglycolate phosphatase